MSVTQDGILQQLQRWPDLHFFGPFFPTLSCTDERSAAFEHKSKNALSRDGGKKSLMHVRIYDVIQKGRVKFKQYGALFISAKVLSVFL